MRFILETTAQIPVYSDPGRDETFAVIVRGEGIFEPADLCAPIEDCSEEVFEAWIDGVTNPTTRADIPLKWFSPNQIDSIYEALNAELADRVSAAVARHPIREWADA